VNIIHHETGACQPPAAGINCVPTTVLNEYYIQAPTILVAFKEKQRQLENNID
jgi:hypothetical protein